MIIYLIYILTGLYFIIGYPYGLNDVENTCYFVLLLSYFLVVGHICYLKFKNKLDIFEPFAIVALFTIFLFNITPMIFIINKTTSLGGVYMMDGCLYGTIIYVLSYFSFAIGYYSRKYQYPTDNPFQMNQIPYSLQSAYLRKALVGWVVCFSCGMMYQIFGNGFSIEYILSLGLSQNMNQESADTPLKYLIAISRGIVPFGLYIVGLSKNRTLKIIVTLLSLILFFIHGQRIYFVLLLGSFIVFYYLKNRTRPSIRTILLLSIIFIIFTSALQFMRVDIHSGQGNRGINVEMSEAINSNFTANNSIILPYYCIVDKIPKQFPHTLGKGYFIEPLVMFLPRILFPWKPSIQDADIAVAMNNCTGYDVVLLGMATPFLSEAYIEFGIVGCIVIMFLFGRILSKLKVLYLYNTLNIHKLIAYSIIYAAIFQVLNRGYMAGNVSLFVFLLLPILIVKTKFSKYDKF